MALSPAKTCIHIVDDDATVLDSLQLLLLVHDRPAATYVSGGDFLENARFAQCDIGLFDLHMPDLNGFDLFTRLRQRNPCARAILMTGHGTADIEREALHRGFCAVLHKPFREATLLAALDGGAASER